MSVRRGRRDHGNESDLDKDGLNPAQARISEDTPFCVERSQALRKREKSSDNP